MLTTKQRGLGADHQRERRRQLRVTPNGYPCWRCGQPMDLTRPDLLDLDHKIDRCMGGTLGPKVLAHRRCNRQAGGRLGNRLKPRRSEYNGPERLEQKPPRWP